MKLLVGPSKLALACLICAAHALAGEPSFEQCKIDLASDARSQGIDVVTVDQVFATIEELPRVITSDRTQPEFTQTFTEYYNRRVTDFRVDEGRRLLAEHGELLSGISAQTGVPPHYLVALWGLETNFGAYFGTLSIPSALATLACDSRRSEFFKRELFAVLEIVERGDIAVDRLVGSWAGAIGHMQFMPTTFLQHAFDASGDGRRDLVGNLADALTSGGRYLATLGWERGYRWGREVNVPLDFDYTLAGYDNWRTLGEWRVLGLRDVFDRPIPEIDLTAALLVPTGHRGPKFLVYPNFKAIMGWNRSQAYALSVGRLADRIAGAGRLHTALPSVASLQIPTTAVQQLQEDLNVLGFDVGNPDGVIGPATRRAVSDFQKQHGLVADGFPDLTTRRRISAARGR